MVRGCAGARVRVCAGAGAGAGVCAQVCMRTHKTPPSPKSFRPCFCFSGKGFCFARLLEKFQLVYRGINALGNFIYQVLDFAILRKPLSFLFDILFQGY